MALAGVEVELVGPAREQGPGAVRTQGHREASARREFVRLRDILDPDEVVNLSGQPGRGTREADVAGFARRDGDGLAGWIEHVLFGVEA